MRFAVIAPVSGLRLYSSLGLAHLVLPQVKNPLYEKFYLEMRARGDLLILDNGAYEEKYNESAFLEALHTYSPQVAVLPDIYLGGEASHELSINFLKKSTGFGCSWCYLPQGKYTTEWYTLATKAVRDYPISWLGLPRNMVTDVMKSPFARVDAARQFHSCYPNVTLLAFGMSDGDYGELWALDKAGVFSCDSSAPVWRGWNGYSLRDPAWKTHGSPVDFDAPFKSNRSDRTVLKNLELCGVKLGQTW